MLALSSILVFLTTFVAVTLAGLMGWFTLQRMGAKAAAEDVSERLAESSPVLLKNDSLSTISLWEKLLGNFDFVEIIQRHLAQADLNWSVGRFTLMMLLSGSITFALLIRRDWIPVWLAVAAALGAACIPYFFIMQRRSSRFRKFEEFFPDTLESLASALRSGHPFAAAIEIVAAESEEPVATELRQVAVEGNFGMSWEVALNNLAARVPIQEVNLFGAAVQLQSRTGGKLNEVLSRIAETMRESTSLKGEVRALAAHGRMTGVVLSILPLVIAGVMLVVNPEYMAVLIRHPDGKLLIAASGVCLVVAHFVIQRIVDIKI